jgi:type IV pilus assembly protein PilY1
VDNDGDTEVDEDDECLVHAGWYYDLSDSGERIVSDVILRDKKLIAISFVPEESACGSGGYSWLHEVDACTGGRLTKPQFDITGDGVIDDNDLITVQIGDEYIQVAPTGIKVAETGRLQPPIILIAGAREIKYFSSTRGTIETVSETSLKLGMSYWKEFK